MNKLITTDNGGYSFEWDDFRFEQDAVRGAITGIMSAFGINPGDPFIISGCSIGSTTYAAGYIFMGGEVFKVDAGARPTVAGGYQLAWVIDVSYDSTGDELLENTNPTSSYQVRKAKLAAITGTPSYIYYAVSGSKTLADKVKGIVDPSNILATYAADIIANSAAWTNHTISSVSYGNGDAVTIGATKILKYKRVGKTCSVSFQLTVASSAATEAEIRIGLPAGCGIPTDIFTGNGYFRNLTTSSYNTGGDIGQHNLFLIAEPDGSGGGHLVMTPSDYKNIYISGSIIVYGSVVFETN